MTDEERFKQYAAQVSSPEKIAELCRKYLMKKGDFATVPQPTKIYLNPQDVVTLNVQQDVDFQLWETLNPAEILSEHRKDMARYLVNQAWIGGHIKWFENKDMANQKMQLRGKLNVWTGNYK